MKNISPLLLILVLFFACKKQEKKDVESNLSEKFPKKVVINLERIKSRKQVTYNKRKRFTKKTAIFTTFSDSLEPIKKTFSNNNPINESIIYNLENNKFINLFIDVSLEKYNYFLKAGDSLTVKFDDDGFVHESLLNGKKDDIALLFSESILPNRTIEYTDLYMKLFGEIDEDKFNSDFEKKFKEKATIALNRIESKKNETLPIIYDALKQHIDYTKISDEISGGNDKKIPLNDSAMSLYVYRKLKSDMLSNMSKINYLADEKLAIRESVKTLGVLMNDEVFKKVPKTRNMIVRELLETTGLYEPNLLPELLSKITDSKIKNEYTKLFTSQFLLNLKKYRNDVNNINLISIKDPEKIFSFKELLTKYKGKVVYVDLWASWCAPCRKQLVASSKLHKELEKKPVEFVYFSTDNSFSRWKTAQIEEKMNEEPNSFLVLNTRKSKQYRSWEVMGIPRYLIFDKTGKLVVKNAPTPSNPMAKEELLKHM